MPHRQLIVHPDLIHMDNMIVAEFFEYFPLIEMTQASGSQSGAIFILEENFIEIFLLPGLQRILSDSSGLIQGMLLNILCTK